MPRPGDANGSRVRPKPDWVVVVPGQCRARCFACGTRVSPFPRQLLLGSKQWGCPFPVMSDGLKRGLCSPAAKEQPRNSQHCHPSVFTPAPVSPPALKGYLLYIHWLPARRSVPVMLSQQVPSAQS